MSDAPDAGYGAHRIAGRSAIWALIGILVGLVAIGVASYIYNQARQDAEQRQAAMALTAGDPIRGVELIAHYGCGGCHTIPGVPAATGQVGPDLSGLARRVYIAGVTTNTVDHLLSFIVDPQSVDPQSAMPVTGITRDEARYVAAYLYAIRQ